MADDEKIIVRKVYFFRIANFNEVGSSIPSCLQKIENLAFNDAGRYLLDPQSQSRLCAFPDKLDYPIRLRFGRIRRDLLPDIEEKGQLQPLDLSEDAGIIDVCHLMIFQDGYVAAEWNHDAPKLSRLGQYLFLKGSDLVAPLKFLNLFERDIVEVVESLNSVRILEIDVPPDAAALAGEAAKGLATAIRATRELGASKKVGLTLVAEIGSPNLKSLAVKLAKLISGSLSRERFTKLTATGYDSETGASRFVDILEDKLVRMESFPRNRDRSRSINSESAYALIESAYERTRDKFDRSATAEDF